MTAFKLDSFGHVTLTCLIKAALFLVLSLVIFIVQANANEKRPILIGLTAEFGVENSASAQSIEKGIALAMHEINSNGGINGRPLKLMSIRIELQAAELPALHLCINALSL